MLRDLLPFLLITVVVMALTYLVTLFIHNAYFLLASRILIAAALYAITMKLLHAKIFEECIEFIRNRKK